MNRTQSGRDGFSPDQHNPNYSESKETAENQSEPIRNWLREYSDEIVHLMSILPRQRFDFNESTEKQQIGNVKKEMADGVVFEWTLWIPSASWVKPRISELFYKIETLVIRPLIKKGYGHNDSWIELGDTKEILSKATDQKYSGEEVREAILFGSSINIEIKLTKREPHKPDTWSLRSFRLCHFSHFRDEQPKPTLGPVGLERLDPEIIEGYSIQPTHSYRDIIRNTIDFEEDPNLVKMDSRAIRLLEILYWNSISEKNNKSGFTPGQINPDDVPYEELVELFPLENVTEV